MSEATRIPGSPEYRGYRRVFPADLNPRGTLFGGRLLSWIDQEAAVFIESELGISSLAARSMAEIEFLNPGHQGDLVQIRVFLTHVGRTSLTLAVEATIRPTSVMVARLSGFVAVHLDADGRPTPHGYSVSGPFPKDSVADRFNAFIAGNRGANVE